MSDPIRLPEPLSAVGINPFVSPSMLTSGQRCALRDRGRNLDGTRVEGLVESPWSIVGRLIHRALQVADARTNIIEVFEALVRRCEVDLLADSRRSHFPPLRTAIGEGGWISRLRILEARRGPGAPFELDRLDDVPEHTGVPRTLGHEVGFQSTSLGLRGVADLVEAIGEDVIRITDWKSGSVTSDDGEVKPEYRLQLAAYVMLARERWPGRTFETYLFNGETIRVIVSRDDEEAVSRAVSQSRALVDERGQLDARGLARLGPECGDCAIRIRCPAYLDVLRREGRTRLTGVGRWTGDILGRVEAAMERNETLIVNLRLVDGSIAQVRCDPPRFSTRVSVGDETAFFGFMALPRRDRMTGAPVAPAVYEEITHSRRAWQAEAFAIT